MSAVAERCLASYLGFACGDALGATVEFMTPEQIRTQYGVHRDIIGGGWLRLKPGQVTDDTEMALALGQAIIERGGWDLRAVADAFADWLKSKPVDVGNTCRRGIRRYLMQGTLSAAPSEYDAGNGACMRNLPVVLATLDNDSDFARWTLEQCHTPYPGRAGGYVVETVQTVLHHFFSTDPFESCVVQTVNCGEDADTTGALAGMLAGAHYGLEAIPRRWLDRLDPVCKTRIHDQTRELLTRLRHE
ncbi:MAG: draG [Proteobacteria bacterium]|nr:draG [Pseudomonadota bacterium]